MELSLVFGQRSGFPAKKARSGKEGVKCKGFGGSMYLDSMNLPPLQKKKKKKKMYLNTGVVLVQVTRKA